MGLLDVTDLSSRIWEDILALRKNNSGRYKLLVCRSNLYPTDAEALAMDTSVDVEDGATGKHWRCLTSE